MKRNVGVAPEGAFFRDGPGVPGTSAAVEVRHGHQQPGPIPGIVHGVLFERPLGKPRSGNHIARAGGAFPAAVDKTSARVSEIDARDGIEYAHLPPEEFLHRVGVLDIEHSMRKGGGVDLVDLPGRLQKIPQMVFDATGRLLAQLSGNVVDRLLPIPEGKVRRQACRQKNQRDKRGDQYDLERRFIRNGIRRTHWFGTPLVVVDLVMKLERKCLDDIPQFERTAVHLGFADSREGNQSFQLWSHIVNMPRAWKPRHCQTRMVWLPSTRLIPTNPR